MVEEPRKEWELRMEIAAAPRAGAVVATLRGAVVRRGDFTLGPVDLQIDWADRVAITGANGSGKSTLLAALLGRLPLDERARRRSGPAWWSARSTRRAGCSSATEPLLDAFGAAVPDAAAAPTCARCWPSSACGRRTCCGPAGDACRPGERTRAALALLQARGVNLLVLDEPTNHLDLPAIEQLESALAAYPGTLLLVTHDRRMLEAVPPTGTSRSPTARSPAERSGAAGHRRGSPTASGLASRALSGPSLPERSRPLRQ